MKKIFSFLFLLIMAEKAICQTETFDITTFTPPKDWTKNTKEGMVIYTNVNTTTGGFCMIAIYTSSISTGSAQKDFNKEWKDLVAGPYKADANPKSEEQSTPDGWKVITAAAPIKLDSLDAYIIATVFSGFGKTTTVLVTLNHQDYLTQVDSFLENISLDKTSKASTTNEGTVNNNPPGNTPDNSIIGTWSNYSASIGNYVTSSGVFVGSADINTMEEYEFKTSKTYVQKFFGSANGKLYYSETTGSYKINGRNLTLTPLKRIGGFSGAIRDEKELLGKPSTFDFYIGPNKWEAGPFLNLHKDGNYYAWSDFPYDYFKKISGSSQTSAQANNITTQNKNMEQIFGNMLYYPPTGWEVKKYSNAEIISPVDLAKGEILEIRVLPPLNFSGSLEQALQQSYDEACLMLQATKMNDVNGGNYSKQGVKKSFKGWEYIRCTGGIQAGSGEYKDEYGLDLFVVKLNNRFERVAIVNSRNSCNLSRYYPYNRLNYYNDIENFLFGLKFNDWKEPVVKPGRIIGDEIVGVWQGISLAVGVPKPGAILGAELKVTSALFFSNGQAYFGTKFPTEGLDELNTWIRAENDGRHWGTYSFVNGKGVLKMPYGDIPLRKDANKLIITPNKTDHGFIKMNPVDGARFNGTYTFSSKNFIGEETGKTPAINFTSDGKFNDNGVLSVLYHEYVDCLNRALTPGSGKYEVKNHTVIFNYDDGRKIRIAFLGNGFTKNNPSPALLIMSSNEDEMKKQ